MKYRILRTTKNGIVTANQYCGSSMNEAWYHYAWQLINPAGKEGTIFLLADNVVIRKEGVGSKLEKGKIMEYLGMKKPSLIKRLAVKLAHVNCGF